MQVIQTEPLLKRFEIDALELVGVELLIDQKKFILTKLNADIL